VKLDDKFETPTPTKPLTTSASILGMGGMGGLFRRPPPALVAVVDQEMEKEKERALLEAQAKTLKLSQEKDPKPISPYVLAGFYGSEDPSLLLASPNEREKGGASRSGELYVNMYVSQ
jgi:hypothetical protein